MGYKMDIPTLSVNEVYTLTFEYEGEETIQLTVGDQTLETTDRRVVFTTTSPVNYIESNVKLENLDLYEGYYESDDQDGEYTQNSYIEGKSLINYKRRVDYGTLINNADIQETFTDDGYINYKQLGTGATGGGFRGNGFVSGIDQSKNYTIILRVRKNTFPTDVFVPFTLCHANHGVKFDEAVKGSHWGISYNISGGQTGVWKAVVKGSSYNVSLSSRYWGSIASFLVDENSEVTDLTQRTDIVGCEIEYAIEVLQGDYFDIDTGIDEHFEGVGSIKSPMIISKEEPNNLFYMRDWTSTLNGGTAYSKDGKIHFSGNFKGYTYFDIINGGESKNNIYLEAGTYHFKTHYKSLSPAPSQGTTISIEVIMADGTYYDVGGAYTFTGSHYDNTISVVKTCASPIVQIKLKIWYGGDRSGIYIDGISISKATNDYTDSKYSVVSTPSDLELYCNHHYDRNTKTSNPCYQDILDLTTGTVTRKNIKVKLNDVLGTRLVEGSLRTVNEVDMVRVHWNHYNTSNNVFPVQIDGEVIGTSATGIVFSASQGGYDGHWFPVNEIEHAYTNTNTLFMYFNLSRFNDIDYTNPTVITNWIKEQDFTLIIKVQNASVYTEQLSLNVLESYRNGSIQISSQQLTPTLTTTLPISNKFTQTNLTTGATYNIHFDGTATSLNCGGTIVNSPTSPCQVKCGDTPTLTIEGEVSNVRVVETSVKNEINTNATNDVELSRIKTKCELYNYFDDYFQGSHNGWAKDGNITSTRDDNKVIVTGKGFGYTGFAPMNGLTLGTYKFHCKVKVQNIGDKYRVLFHSNPNGANNNTDGFAWAETTSTQLVEEINYVGYFRNANIALFYAYTNGQVVEYYDISLIKLSDDDITGADTSGINYSQVISDLKQPIKLRSLGTTYDSYNPVTGELTKRIRVSETDGSYSVLSSPIVENISMGIPITNLIINTFPITGFTNLSGNFKPNTTYTVFLDIGAVNGETASGFVNNSGAGGWGSSQYSYTVGKQVFTRTTDSTTGGFVYRLRGNPTINSAMIIEGDLTNYDLEYFIGTKQLHIPPHLYTNGQVKVYSDSEVYPTTILNGQSTNNYEINELNRYNNYTIRYDGTCESINLNGKSNEPGTNRIVKTSTDGRGNLTFVNDNGDINNVLLVEHDVREQEINHFNGLQTVEVCKMIVQSPISKHLFYNYGLNDFVPGVNTNYSFDENNNLVLSNGYGNNVDTMLQTVDKYTLEKGDSVIFRVVEIGNFAADHRLMVKLATQSFAFGGYYADTYVNFKAPKVQEIINEQGYCDVVYIYNGETTTDNIQISNYFGKWIISSVVLCKQSQEIITPIIIDLPQPVQLNRIHKENMPYGAWSNVLGQHVNLADGITYDSYNPITGEYIQRVYKMTLNGDDGIKYIDNWSGVQYAIDDSTLPYPRKQPHKDTVGRYAGLIDVDGVPYGASYNVQNDIFVTWLNYNAIVLNLPRQYTNNIFNQNACKQWLRENPITLYYELETPITTQLTPINIPTLEGGILQLITTDDKVFPMIEYSMPTNNRYDTSMWNVGNPITQRNATEIYINGSTTPTTPTETMTFTKEQLSSGSIIINDNGDGLMVLNGDYTGRDIPYFTGMRSVESIEVETTPSPDQPLFGKGGRK